MTSFDSSLRPLRLHLTHRSSVATWLLVGCALLGARPATVAAQPASATAVTVRYREPADVFEILDHVSAWWPEYVEAAYRQAWIAGGYAAPDDSSYFAQYAALRARHFDRTGQTGQTGGAALRRDGSGLFTAAAALDADPVAAAFYASDTMADAFDRLRPLLTADELTFLRAFYAHFRSRTTRLSAETRAATAASREATARTLADPAVGRYLGQAAALVAGARSASETAVTPTFDALYVWWPDTAQTRATPGGRALILRVRPTAADTINSADVVAHEAIHVFAAGLAVARQQQLSGALLDGCAIPTGTRRLAVLEEPIATALGNIEFRRRFMPQRFTWGRRWYGDAWVDAYARLLHPVLMDMLAAGRTFDAPFTRDAVGLCTSLARVRGSA